MRVLIVGGTGLISNAITKKLIDCGGFEITHYNRGQRTRAYDMPVSTVTGNRYDHAEFTRHMYDLPVGTYKHSGKGTHCLVENG